MRKVVDSSFMQDERLQNFFSASQNNYAVLTDYAAMEAYKGDTLKSISKSMAILADYPSQVIILKSTTLACGSRGRLAGLQRRLIDEGQTRGFEKYCKDLATAIQGDAKYQKELLKMGREATEHLDQVRDDVSSIGQAVEEIAKSFRRDELRMLRNREAFTDEFRKKMLLMTVELAGDFFEEHPRATFRLNMKELPNTFLFRYALCALLQLLYWIEAGGPHNAKPEKIRNDVVDLNIATFGTYFDGVLSADKKLLSIHDTALFVLTAIAPAERFRRNAVFCHRRCV